MKKFLKFLGITALAAALVPYRVDKDEETGDLTLDALLWQGKRSVRDGEKHINVNFAPWFSPHRTDDLDSLEPEDPEEDLEALEEDLEALEEDFEALDEDLDDLDETQADGAPTVEITVTVTPDEQSAPAEPTAPEA